MRWDAARAASRRQLPKPRKMHGPVGQDFGVERVPQGVRYDACTSCGFHLCICKPEWLCGAGCGRVSSRVLCDDCRSDAPEPPNDNGPIDYFAMMKAKPPRPHPNGCPCQGCVPTAEVKPFELRAYAQTAFDDHVKHATAHMQAAERIGICGLCHSAEHKLLACPAYIRALEACR